MRFYIMQMGTTITGRRGWMVLMEVASEAAGNLYIEQNPGDNLKLEVLT